MAKYTANQIGHWFIVRNRLAEDEYGAETITLLKLLKLLYYAEGCYLALTDGESLFDEKIVAWEHGPVVEEVYNEYNDPYHIDTEDLDVSDIEKIEQSVQDILEQVFQVFGHYSAWDLRNKTHEEKPWLEATQNGKILKREISRKTMQEFFKENYID